MVTAFVYPLTLYIIILI